MRLGVRVRPPCDMPGGIPESNTVFIGRHRYELSDQRMKSETLWPLFRSTPSRPFAKDLGHLSTNERSTDRSAFYRFRRLALPAASGHKASMWRGNEEKTR
jgi:hypothetical protein